MAEQHEHGISWCTTTWNPIRGCSMAHGSELGGCLNCYAARQAVRHSGPGRPYEGLARMTSSGPRWTGEVRLVPEHLADPLHWTRPRRIFVNSMSDLFHESVEPEEIAAIFGVMALCQRHTFQVLTKRPLRMCGWLSLARDHGNAIHRCVEELRARIGPLDISDGTSTWPLKNVWLIVSCENQPTADARIPPLLQTPAAVRGVSAEPLLGPIDLSRWLNPCVKYGCTSHHNLDWVIAGGESGPDARPMHPDWARSLRDQCQAAGVAFHFKQFGEWNELIPEALWDGKTPIRMMNDAGESVAVEGERSAWNAHQAGYTQRVARVGKRAAGRLLDGREWNQYPEVMP